MDAYEVSIREIIEILFQGKKIIAGCTILVLLVTAGYNYYFIKPVYQAKIVLGVDPSAFVKGDTIQQYMVQIKNPEVLKKVSDRLAIDGEKISESKLAVKIDASIIKGTDFLEIAATDINSSLAEKIVGITAEEYIVYINSVNKTKTAEYVDLIYSLKQKEQEKLDQGFQKEIETIQQPNSHEALSNKLAAALDIVRTLEREIMLYKNSISGLQANRLSLESQIKNVPQRITLKTADIIAGTGLELLREELNPIYTDLSWSIEINKAQYAQAMAAKATAEKQLAEANNSVSQIRSELAEQKVAFEKFQMELNLIKQVYNEYLRQYNTAEQNAFSSLNKSPLSISQDVQAELMEPNKARNIAVGGFMGVLTGVLLAYVRRYWSIFRNKSVVGIKTGVE